MYHFIINPSAGNERAQKSWTKIQKKLCQLNLKHSYYLTTSSTDLKQHLRQQAKLTPKTIFVILGGDGTLYHALNAIAFPTKLDVILGYIPCGSGNDFAKAAQISTDPNKALAQLLAQKAPRTLDLGYFKTSDRAGVFSNNLGLGFDAQIVEITNNSPLKNQLNKLHLGKFAYATCFFKALRRQKTFALTVTLPNFPPKNFSHAFLCTITDQPYFGGGVALFPKARLDDGKLTLVVIEKKNLLDFLSVFLLMLLPGAYHLLARSLSFYTTTKLKLTTTTPQNTLNLYYLNKCGGNIREKKISPNTLVLLARFSHCARTDRYFGQLLLCPDQYCSWWGNRTGDLVRCRFWDQPLVDSFAH